MRLFAFTIFASSFLLFQVQPMIGKAILPWFGGTPAVWTACLLFFQSALLAGYAYAHWLAERVSPGRQAVLHAAMMVLTLAWLPVGADEAWKPADADWPVPRVLGVLLASVGGPFLVLSSTAPLLQDWFRRTCPGQSPYRLYALSNAGSLLGLFAYPFWLERILTLPQQGVLWSGGYLLFVGLCGLAGWRLARRPGEAAGSGPVPEAAAAADRPTNGLGALDSLMWLLLSACGSAVLLAVTNQLCQNVAAVPFLWVLPLGLYLVTFILCFDSDGWYRREWFVPGWLAALATGLWLALGGSPPLPVQIALYGAILFVCCMVCHGELARLRPEPARLTRYFFLMSAGGALGGVFVSLVAPVCFDRYHEFQTVLFGTGLLLVLIYRREFWLTLTGEARRRSIRQTLASGAALGGLAVALFWISARLGGAASGDTLARDRNFYGVVSAQREVSRDPRWTVVSFTHGNTTHGFQFSVPERRGEATGYYQPGSGVALALERHPARLEGRPLRVGLIGLGVGTLAAYARPGDELVFYEIDPNVERFARSYFSFLSEAEGRGASVRVRLGDARILLEREARSGDAGEPGYDVLVLDAFSSDAVPVHLLTREAFALYRNRLRAGGILAAHLSNQHLDLTPVIRTSAGALGGETVQIWHQTPADSGLPPHLRLHSQWILSTAGRGFLDQPEVRRSTTPWTDSGREIGWTDQYSSLFEVLR